MQRHLVALYQRNIYTKYNGQFLLQLWATKITSKNRLISEKTQGV